MSAGLGAGCSVRILHEGGREGEVGCELGVMARGERDLAHACERLLFGFADLGVRLDAVVEVALEKGSDEPG
ncbi:Hypothetical Protein RradSPS_1453 [Rubrobacter radiotolerans]|uniref:Uncharacterized protein n=1 Tax=Rubrobacter radiotolerans TaxID=42256 RepID=A0A023X3G7_RUBRA|nr:hypothetical protein [Rubrobacter radiotolerans]AHY46736.1 Hypothetical Protein RradSPS_1453 [Rubrobacter radiotolerans]MDX5894143.1 hypothetical protein [Rubrobacter radiotolerans]SMC05296.1 hypothetical protein SAMN00767673_1453 [Rubrobacter radiotolerans DSM 5868]